MGCLSRGQGKGSPGLSLRPCGDNENLRETICIFALYMLSWWDQILECPDIEQLQKRYLHPLEFQVHVDLLCLDRSPQSHWAATHLLGQWAPDHPYALLRGSGSSSCQQNRFFGLRRPQPASHC